MRITDDALTTRNKFIAQLDSMDDIELKRRYNEALDSVFLLRERMEKDTSDMLESLKQTDKNSLFDEWFYSVNRIVNDYEDWFIYRDLAISAKDLIEFRKGDKGVTNGRD